MRFLKSTATTALVQSTALMESLSGKKVSGCYSARSRTVAGPYHSASPLSEKVHKSALAIVPRAGELYNAIQGIRTHHDKQVRFRPLRLFLLLCLDPPMAPSHQHSFCVDQPVAPSHQHSLSIRARERLRDGEPIALLSPPPEAAVLVNFHFSCCPIKQAAALLHSALEDVPPFDVCFSRFNHFRHGPKSHTMWLAPEGGCGGLDQRRAHTPL